MVYSEEIPVQISADREVNEELSTEQQPVGKRAIPGSVAFVPSVAGLIIAGEVIKDISNGSVM